MLNDRGCKTALIFGIDGQDGSYLGELLLDKGYAVIGWVPTKSVINHENLSKISQRIKLIEGDLEDSSSLIDVLLIFKPDEVYNLASPSFAAGSWEDPELVAEVSGLGVLRILEAMRQVIPQGRFFQASSSEVFGDPVESPQNEKTPFHPRNPYGIAKTFAHYVVSAYRRKYNIFAVSGILYNHESPRRPRKFVTRKITDGAARVYYGLLPQLVLGDLDARRDWSYAGDIVRAMWMMLQSSSPRDFVIGSGFTWSVRDVCQIAFSYLGMDYHQFVVSGEKYLRPRETILLCADPSEINTVLGWKAEVDFRKLIEMMVDADLEKIRIEKETADQVGS